MLHICILSTVDEDDGAILREYSKEQPRNSTETILSLHDTFRQESIGYDIQSQVIDRIQTMCFVGKPVLVTTTQKGRLVPL